MEAVDIKLCPGITRTGEDRQAKTTGCSSGQMQTAGKVLSPISVTITAKKFRPTGSGSFIVSPIDNRQPSFCRWAPLQRILDIYLSEQENPAGLLKFKDRTRLNSRLNR